MAKQNGGRGRFVVCVRNTGHRASLEVRKIYRALADRTAEKHGMLRVIDESGEAYLYPATFFVAVDLPKPLRSALRRVG